MFRIIWLVQRPFRTKVQLPDVGRRIQVQQAVGTAANGPASFRPELDGGVIIVSESQIKNEPLVDAPVVLNESAVFIQAPIVRGVAIRKKVGRWPIGEQICEAVIDIGGSYRIQLKSSLPEPSKTHLDVVRTDNTAEFLFEVKRAAPLGKVL